MLTLYIVCAIAGGGLVLLSAFGADADADGGDVELGGADADADVGEVDLGAEVGGGAPGAGALGSGAMTAASDANAIATVAGRDKLWMTLFSFRFWTFTAAFFGVTGATLTFTTGLAGGMVGGLATGMGVAVGFVADRAMRFMRRREVNSAVELHDLVGREAHVLLPVRGERAGKIRVQVGTRELEYLAVSEEESPFERGATGVIIDVSGDRVRIVHPSTLLGRDT